MFGCDIWDVCDGKYKWYSLLSLFCTYLVVEFRFWMIIVALSVSWHLISLYIDAILCNIIQYCLVSNWFEWFFSILIPLIFQCVSSCFEFHVYPTSHWHTWLLYGNTWWMNWYQCNYQLSKACSTCWNAATPLLQYTIMCLTQGCPWYNIMWQIILIFLNKVSL